MAQKTIAPGDKLWLTVKAGGHSQNGKLLFLTIPGYTNLAGERISLSIQRSDGDPIIKRKGRITGSKVSPEKIAGANDPIARDDELLLRIKIVKFNGSESTIKLQIIDCVDQYAEPIPPFTIRKADRKKIIQNNGVITYENN